MCDSHPDLEPFRRGLFAVDATSHPELLGNIGNWVMYKSSHGKGTSSLLPHRIVHLQNDYRGRVVYRVENQLNTFGRVADPDEIRIVSVEEATKIWNSNVESVYGHFEEFNPDF